MFLSVNCAWYIELESLRQLVVAAFAVRVELRVGFRAAGRHGGTISVSGDSETINPAANHEGH